MTGATDLNVDIHISRGTFTLVAKQHFPPGTVTAIIGSNGAGKTTLLEGIAGFLTLDQGRITQGTRVLADHSERVSLPPYRRSIALLGQKGQLFPHMSVADNIAFGPRVQKASTAEIKARTSLWANRLDLEGVLERLPRELSGGQQQRVALARALASHPTTLLLDEPTASLDVEAASSFRAALSDELRQEPVTTLLVTHAIEDVIGLADHLVVIEDGAITASGPAREQLTKPATTFVANFAGLNRLAASASGNVMLADGIPLAGTQAPPPEATLVALPPEAVRFNQPTPLDSNTWDTTVTTINAKRLGFAIECASPRGLVGYADLTEMARLDLQVGSRVTVSIDPDQITAY